MQRRTALVLALCVLVSFVSHLVVINADILNGDEAAYAVGSWELLHGRVPYTAFADNKPPLVYVYYAIAQLVAGHGIQGVRVVTALALIPLTALALSAFYRHDRRGVTAALAFLVVSASYDAPNMLAVNCETLMMLPLAWAAVAMRSRGLSLTRAGTAGLLVGVAMLLKYHAVFWVPALLLPSCIEMWSTNRKGVWRNAVGFLAGAALPIATAIMCFVLLGAFDDFWYWNVTHNLGYVMNPTSLGDTLPRASVRVGAFIIATAVLWIGLVKSHSIDTDPRDRRLITWLVVMSALACLPGWRFFSHYFVVLYVPLALGAAPWLASRIASFHSWDTRIGVAYVALCFGVFTGINLREARQHNPSVNALARSVADRLRQDPCFGNGSLFVWGYAPTIYYHAGLSLGSRYFFPEFPLVRYYPGNRAATVAHAEGIARDHRMLHWRTLIADLSKNEPTYFIDTAPAKLALWEGFPLADYPLLAKYVDQRYTYLDAVNDVRIYRANGCDAALLATAPTRGGLGWARRLIPHRRRT